MRLQSRPCPAVVESDMGAGFAEWILDYVSICYKPYRLRSTLPFGLLHNDTESNISDLTIPHLLVSLPSRRFFLQVWPYKYL